MLVLRESNLTATGTPGQRERGATDHEGVLAPEWALPVQFHYEWHHSRNLDPERELALAVFWQAIHDLETHRFAKRLRHQKMYASAWRWANSPRRDWPFSFLNLCDLFSFEADTTRQRLLRLGVPPSVEEPLPASRG